MTDAPLTVELVEARAGAGEHDRRAVFVAAGIRRFADEIAVVGWNGPGPPPAHARFARSAGLYDAAVAAGEAVIVADVAADPRYLTTQASTRSEIVVPVSARGGVVGLIGVESERTRAFGEADKQLLERCAAVIVPLWRPHPLAAGSGQLTEVIERAEPAVSGTRRSVSPCSRRRDLL